MSSKTPPAMRPKGAQESKVLVLQGGGALGAYQAGVYEELAATGCAPHWVAGMSIGAVNAALIAGNPPERRLERLKSFWDSVTSHLLAEPAVPGEYARALFNETSAAFVAAFGIPSFFEPRLPPALVYPPGAPEALSLYDTAPLRRTLEALIDFDRINSGEVRLSVGAVNIRSGNFVYFDNKRQKIGPEHIMASGALPIGFPPIGIDGEHYWDGGLVSNTPLQYVMDEVPRSDMLIFQVDLFSARGAMPRTLLDAYEREKDIRYSSRTRLNTDVFRDTQALRRAAHRLLEKLPEKLKNDPDVKLLRELSCNAAVTICHLIHRQKSYQSHSKDYEFSRYSIREHWQAGRDDVRRTLQSKTWQRRERPRETVTVFDLARDARD
ncbi:MAG: patatin-like phospholipase family protein [Kiloniellales bacterium]